MNNIYQHLPWDSNIFDFTVAKIIPERLTFDELKTALTDLKSQNVKLVYWASDSQNQASQQAAKQCQGFLADHKVTYLMSLANVDRNAFPHPDVQEYAAKEPTAELEFLALQSGLYSRFKADPKIPDEIFEKIYKLWITNSTNHSVADNVLIVNKNHKMAGMITLGDKNKRGDIGLLAVHPDFRGQQIGSILIKAAQAWFAQKGYLQSQVVTQHTNEPACKLYEKCSYQIEKVENFYHFWI